jgi:hypothetical protein
MKARPSMAQAYLQELYSNVIVIAIGEAFELIQVFLCGSSGHLAGGGFGGRTCRG